MDGEEEGARGLVTRDERGLSLKDRLRDEAKREIIEGRYREVVVVVDFHDEWRLLNGYCSRGIRTRTCVNRLENCSRYSSLGDMD